MAANAGTNVCLQRVDAKLIFDAIRDRGVTRMCGAGVVYNMLINAPVELRVGAVFKMSGYVAGAPPASTIRVRSGSDLTSRMCTALPKRMAQHRFASSKLNGRPCRLPSALG